MSGRPFFSENPSNVCVEFSRDGELKLERQSRPLWKTPQMTVLPSLIGIASILPLLSALTSNKKYCASIFSFFFLLSSFFFPSDLW